MSTDNKMDAVCIVSTILTVVLTILLMNGVTFGAIPVISKETDSGMFTSSDLNADWNSTSATEIALSDMGSVISGNGAYVYDGDVYIAYAGLCTYRGTVGWQRYY